MDLLTGPVSGPLDDEGRLLHEDDPAAQLALATVRLEAALRRAGRRPADLTGLRVLTTDRDLAAGVLDVLVERLETTGARPHIAIVEVDQLGVTGMLVALEPTVPAALPDAPLSDAPLSDAPLSDAPLSDLSLRSPTSGRTPKEAT
jgi:enamine deaminase RidA (YjgF/YER057c/UK114 family)